MINVAELMIDPDFMQTLQGERTSLQIATQGDVAGEVVPVATPLTVLASAQPTSKPDELALLPEGYRNESTIKMYTATELFASDGNETAPVPATVDVVFYLGKRYRVMYVKLYGDYGFWFSLAVQEKGQAS